MNIKRFARRHIKGLRILYWKYYVILSWRNFRRSRKDICDRTIEWGESTPQNRKEYKNEIAYLKKHGATHFPYKWAKLGFVWRIKMGFDEDDSPYVVHQNHRIYVLPYAYSQLMLEQNVNSPHRYLGGAIPEIEQGSVFVDVGAAEGIMAVESLKRASKVYVIERDPSWLSRLNKTFSGEKNVTIINKYASCKDDEENITLDTLLDKVTEPILIKLDVEGMELEVLLGAENLLKKENVKLLIATYHKPGDPETLQAYMEERGFCTEFTDGYIAPMWPGVTAPYLRKALLRAWKE